jgi:type I restriction enzyme, S subunit
MKTEIDKTAWKKVAFGELCRNLNISEKNPLGNGLDRYVGLEHIEPNNLHITSWGNIAEGTTFTKRFTRGHLLFGKRRSYLRKAAIAEFDGICSGDILVFEANEKVIEPGLLAFVVSSDRFFDYAIQTSAGSLSPRTKFQDLEKLEFLIPPKEQQSKLAELLWAVDKVCYQQQLINSKLEKLKLRYLQNIINPKLPKEKLQSTSFGFIPKQWSVKKVSEVSDIEYGISDAVANNNDSTLGCPILTGANINLDGTFNIDELVYYQVPTKDKFLLQFGDLLFNWRSGSSFHVGKTAYFDLEGMYTYASFMLRIRAKKDFDSRFGWYLFNYLRGIEYFTKGISQQVNFKMNANVFREVQLPIPPLEEQKVYSEELDKIRKSYLMCDSFIDSSSRLKRELINKIFC